MALGLGHHSVMPLEAMSAYMSPSEGRVVVQTEVVAGTVPAALTQLSEGFPVTAGPNRLRWIGTGPPDGFK